MLGPSGNDARSYRQQPFTLTLTPYGKGCAPVRATLLGKGAACKYNYCSMSGLPSASLKIFLLRLASIRLWWHQCPPFTRDCLRYHDARLRELDDPAIVKSLSNGPANYPWKFSKPCADSTTKGRNGRNGTGGWVNNQ